MEDKYLKIDGIIETKLNTDDLFDEFIKFLESKKSYYYGISLEIDANIPEIDQISKNTKITLNDKKYLVSRSCATVSLVFLYDKNGNWFILAIKRAKGADGFNGFWCLPCGYVDYGETTREAAKREIYEETGLKLNHTCLSFIGIDSEPEGKKQNITIRYSIIVPLEDFENSLRIIDTKEVEEIKLIPIDEINKYNWAFNHASLIKIYSVNLLKNMR